jgi:hypothetical protein
MQPNGKGEHLKHKNYSNYTSLETNHLNIIQNPQKLCIIKTSTRDDEKTDVLGGNFSSIEITLGRIEASSLASQECLRNEVKDA